MPLQQAAGSRQQPKQYKQSLHLKKPLAMENPIAKNSKNLQQTTVKVRRKILLTKNQKLKKYSGKFKMK